MKIPLDWLTEWVKVPWDARTLGARLTMAGFELESLTTAAPAFTNVVIGEIVSAEPHPQADKLQVCAVSIGSGSPLQIVCGAANARAGLRTALAVVGAQLPGRCASARRSCGECNPRACWPRAMSSEFPKVTKASSSFPAMRHSG